MALTISILTFLCFWWCNAVSLNTTTIAFPKNAIGSVRIYINIVNPLDAAVLVDVSAPRIPSVTTTQAMVPPKDVLVIELDTADFEITGTGTSGKGILIQSNVSDLIITGLSTALNSGDMFFARKASQLGFEYIIITYCERNYFCQFTVIADEDNTVIEIVLPGYFTSVVVFDGTNYGPGDVISLNLQKTQTFQIQSTSDLSGVKIVSTNKKRFSVLSGSSFTTVQSGSGREYLADLVPPTSALGSEYVLVRRNIQKYDHDYVKFAAAASGANISVFGCGTTFLHQILGFQTYLFSMTCERVHVISDEPILLAHFPVGSGLGDSAMFFPTPTYQHVSEYTVYIPPGFRYCAIAFVIESRHVNAFNLSIFTGSFTHWQNIDQSVYSTAWVNDVKSGVMEIAHTSPFGGHVLCERATTILAFPIGLWNLTQNETQEYFSTSTIAESSTTQIVNETLINSSSTEVLGSTTGITVSNNVTALLSTYVTSEPTYSDKSTGGTYGVTVSSNTVGDVTTSPTHSNVSESALNCSCCKTSSYSDSDLPPPEILLEIIDDLKKTLSVPKKTTSNYVSKHTSAWDERASSARIGVLGIVVLCGVFGSIIAIDMATLFQKRR